MCLGRCLIHDATHGAPMTWLHPRSVCLLCFLAVAACGRGQPMAAPDSDTQAPPAPAVVQEPTTTPLQTSEHVSAGPTRLWFFDLNTGKIFAGPIEQLPPIPAPSGDLIGHPGTPAGVLASVIRVEGDPVQRVAFIQVYTPEAKRLIEASRRVPPGSAPPDYERIMAGTMVAYPPKHPGDPVAWINMAGPDGYRVTMSVDELSGGKPYAADLP